MFAFPCARSFFKSAKGTLLLGLCLYSGGGFVISKIIENTDDPQVHKLLSGVLVFWYDGVGC